MQHSRTPSVSGMLLSRDHATDLDQKQNKRACIGRPCAIARQLVYQPVPVGMIRDVLDTEPVELLRNSRHRRICPCHECILVPHIGHETAELESTVGKQGAEHFVNDRDACTVSRERAGSAGPVSTN